MAGALAMKPIGKGMFMIITWHSLGKGGVPHAGEHVKHELGSVTVLLHGLVYGDHVGVDYTRPSSEISTKKLKTKI